jgi:hypothetical protein
VCGREFDNEVGSRKGKDTCSVECGTIKVKAWIEYLKKHKDKLIEKAIKEYLDNIDRGDENGDT